MVRERLLVLLFLVVVLPVVFLAGCTHECVHPMSELVVAKFDGSTPPGIL